MDHEQALAAEAVERYLLNELTPVESEDFEEHFFGCAECAEAVKIGTILIVNGKALAKETARRPSATGQVTPIKTRPARPMVRAWRWRRDLPSIAAALLVAVVGYQNLVIIPHLRRSAIEPQAVTAYVTLRPQARGTAPMIDPASQLSSLHMDLNALYPEPSYRVEVRNGSGAVLVAFPNVPVHDGGLEISLRAGSLPPGAYEILVRGATDTAGSFPFEIGK